MSPPVARVYQAREERGLRPREVGSGISSGCPAHEDSRPSLSVSEGHDGRWIAGMASGVEASIGLSYALLDPETRMDDKFVADEEARRKRNQPYTTAFHTLRQRQRTHGSKVLLQRIRSRDDRSRLYLRGAQFGFCTFLKGKLVYQCNASLRDNAW